MDRPFACVKKDEVSYCGRYVGATSTEFTFRDPAHAVHFYAGSRYLDVCERCVAAIGEVTKPVRSRP